MDRITCLARYTVSASMRAPAPFGCSPSSLRCGIASAPTIGITGLRTTSIRMAESGIRSRSYSRASSLSNPENGSTINPRGISIRMTAASASWHASIMVTRLSRAAARPYPRKKSCPPSSMTTAWGRPSRISARCFVMSRAVTPARPKLTTGTEISSRKYSGKPRHSPSQWSGCHRDKRLDDLHLMQTVDGNAFLHTTPKLPLSKASKRFR